MTIDYAGSPTYLRTLAQAQRLGYASVNDAITAMRGTGYTWRDISGELGMSENGLRLLARRVAHGEPECGKRQGMMPGKERQPTCGSCGVRAECSASVIRRGQVLCGEAETEADPAYDGESGRKRRTDQEAGWHWFCGTRQAVDADEDSGQYAGPSGVLVYQLT